MKLINPSVEIWTEGDHVSHVARCARVCYASESDSKESNEKLIKSLENKGHTSMFRHETRYFIIEQKNCPVYRKIYYKLREYNHCPYIDFKCNDGIIYITTNGDFYRNNEFKDIINLIYSYEVNAETFKSTEIGCLMMRFTVSVITQISTSRELNRTSPNNIAEQSTRYVNFGKKGGITICLPHWWNDSTRFKRLIHICYWKSCELMYNLLLRLGFTPQDARGVLPLDTATKAIYTYTLCEWMHILDLRYYGITGKPHPNAKEVAKHIKTLIELEGYNFENGI